MSSPPAVPGDRHVVGGRRTSVTNRFHPLRPRHDRNVVPDVVSMTVVHLSHRTGSLSGALGPAVSLGDGLTRGADVTRGPWFVARLSGIRWHYPRIRQSPEGGAPRGLPCRASTWREAPTATRALAELVIAVRAPGVSLSPSTPTQPLCLHRGGRCWGRAPGVAPHGYGRREARRWSVVRDRGLPRATSPLSNICSSR